MTLVLPFGVDQIASTPLFSGSGTNQNSSMPCVFDSDAFERDFESALMRDWASGGINEYSLPAEDSPMKTPSDANELKRKSPVDGENEHESLSKKPRFENAEIVSSTPDIISSSSSGDLSSSTTSSSLTSSFLESNLMDSTSTSASSSSSSSSTSSSSSEGGQDDDASPEVDDEDYMPRRRGIQMWNSRQRWKDERKKVLKMSVTKLAEIEDPELCLLRSVLINNTIKKLHADIKNERLAKVRQRQQRMDFFAERFPPISNAIDTSEQFGFGGRDHQSATKPNTTSTPTTAVAPDFYDDTSCDEIFGISEDFLRVSIPDRRVSSPVPTSPNQSCRSDSRDSESDPQTESSPSSPMDVSLPVVVTTANVTCPSPCYGNNTSNSSLPSCDTAVDCSSPFYNQRRNTVGNNNSQTVISAAPAFPSTPPPQNRRSVSTAPSTGGGQCAMQYRTNRDMRGGFGDVSFPPRVPILDSVVYHSLLASLESS